jgi:hypothetical protein
MNLAKVSGKLKEQIRIFSGKVSVGLPKVAGRFVEETLYGISSQQSLHLSKIARSLNEKIPLIKTINRLSIQLSRRGLWEKITAGILNLAEGSIGSDTLLVADISDINKPYAKRMEYLARVHDGSAGGLVEGYWLCQVIAAEIGRSEVIPLYNRLYSLAAPDCAGENKELFRAINLVSRAVGNRGIWVIDRGGDRRTVFDYFLSNHKRFVVRLKGNRFLIHKNEKVIAKELAHRCFCPFTGIVVREKKEEERAYHISYGFCKILLPDIPKPLFMVVVHGFGSEPMMILTNLPLKKDRKTLLNIIKSYITRWRIEETIRFIKQSYNLEDIRVQTYIRLQNMMALVLAAAYFTSVYVGGRLKMRIVTAILLRMSKRIFGVPDFRYYAIADGIKELLGRNPTGPLRLLPQWIPKNQLQLLMP